MERLVVNRTGRPRRAKLNGRDYIVLPMSMVVPGVLNGSKGPLYYPPKLVASTASRWNGVPILLGHPDGSGRTPETIEQFGLGTVFNAKFSGGKLRAEGWLEIDRLTKLVPDSVAYLENGGRLELSTGFDTSLLNEEGMFNNIQYNATVGDIRPDHLALFTNGEVGACGVIHGCGVNNKRRKKNPKYKESSNGDKEMPAVTKAKKSSQQDSDKSDKVDKAAGKSVKDKEEENVSNRGELETVLVNNCSCSEEDVKSLDERALRVLQQVFNSLPKEESTVSNQNEQTEDDGEEGKVVKTSATKVDNAKKPATRKEVSVEEFLANIDAPEEIKMAVRNARDIAQREKDELILNIKRNQRTPWEDKFLDSLALDDQVVNVDGVKRLVIGLRSLKDYGAPQDPVNVRIPSYLGAAVTNRQTNERPQPLGLPSWDFEPAKN